MLRIIILTIGCHHCMHLSTFNALQHFCHGGGTHIWVFTQTLIYRYINVNGNTASKDQVKLSELNSDLSN